MRQIIGITGRAGTATFIESESRMAALLPSQCQVVRGILLDYDNVGLETLSVLGGQKGANYNIPRDKEALATELRRMLYPSASNDSPELGSSYTPVGSISVIPVTYLVGDQTDLK